MLRENAMIIKLSITPVSIKDFPGVVAEIKICALLFLKFVCNIKATIVF